MYVYKNVMLYTLSILQFCQLELKNLKEKKKDRWDKMPYSVNDSF